MNIFPCLSHFPPQSCYNFCSCKSHMHAPMCTNHYTHWHTAGSACTGPRWSLHTGHTMWAERGCRAGSRVPRPSPRGAGGPGCCSGLWWSLPGSEGLAPSPGWSSGRWLSPGVEVSRANVRSRSTLSALCPTSGHGARWTRPKTLCHSEPAASIVTVGQKNTR